MVFAYLFVGLAYIIGSIPTGYWFAQLFGVRDIRQYGSGNIGATNVARLLGPQYFVIIFCLDFLKAYGAVVGAQYLFQNDWVTVAAAGAVFMGNIASIFLQFHGGRGIATGAGIVMAYDPTIALIIFLAWLIVLGVVRIVGVASVVALVVLPIAVCIKSGFLTIFFFLSILMSFIGLYRHKTHINAAITHIITKGCGH